MMADGQDNTLVKEKPNAGLIIQLPPGGIELTEVERDLVRQAMERAGGNQTRAAELLGLKRDALRRRLAKYGFHHSHAESAAEAGPRNRSTKKDIDERA